MMRFKILSTIFFTSILSFLNAQLLESPIEGVYSEDYIIVNYIDWGVSNSTDFQKGTKTYKGHAGTDFTLKSFPQMDQGVYVNAVDSGIVTFVHDGEFDRNTDGNTSLGFGNYITIRHPSKLYSYYAHLRKNSILVKPGDKVSAGQHIAFVGSSGNSTDPHLHLEMWYDSLYLVEPFAGSCGIDYSHFEEVIPYDTSFNVWESGLTDFVPSINDLRDRPIAKDKFNDQDSIVTFWALQYGIKSGDSTRIEWITPNGSLWFEYSTTYDKDWWYYYYNSYIFTPSSTIWGNWKCNYYYNDKLVASEDFEVEKPNGIQDIDDNSYYKIIDKQSIEVFMTENALANSMEVFDVSGKRIMHKDLYSEKSFVINISSNSEIPKVYLISVKHSKGFYNFKVWL